MNGSLEIVEENDRVVIHGRFSNAKYPQLFAIAALINITIWFALFMMGSIQILGLMMGVIPTVWFLAAGSVYKNRKSFQAVFKPEYAIIVQKRFWAFYFPIMFRRVEVEDVRRIGDDRFELHFSDITEMKPVTFELPLGTAEEFAAVLPGDWNLSW